MPGKIIYIGKKNDKKKGITGQKIRGRIDHIHQFFHKPGFRYEIQALDLSGSSRRSCALRPGYNALLLNIDMIEYEVYILYIKYKKGGCHGQ